MYFSTLARNFTLSVGLSTLCAAAIVISGNARAGAGGWVSDSVAQARLVVAEASVDGQEFLSAGVQIRMEEGWETYWRTPGNAGMPPVFDWSASENVANVEVSYPVPLEREHLGMTTFAYMGQVVFPVSITVADPTKSVQLRLALTYAVCRDVCIPLKADLAIDVPSAGGPSNKAFYALIEGYRKQVPNTNRNAEMSIESATLTTADPPYLEILGRARVPMIKPRVIVEGPPGLSFHTSITRLLAGGRRALLLLDVIGSDEDRGELLNMLVTVTLIDGDRAVETTLSVVNAD